MMMGLSTCDNFDVHSSHVEPHDTACPQGRSVCPIRGVYAHNAITDAVLFCIVGKPAYETSTFLSPRTAMPSAFAN